MSAIGRLLFKPFILNRDASTSPHHVTAGSHNVSALMRPLILVRNSASQAESYSFIICFLKTVFVISLTTLLLGVAAPDYPVLL